MPVIFWALRSYKGNRKTLNLLMLQKPWLRVKQHELLNLKRQFFFYFQPQISRLTEIILERDTEEVYKFFRVPKDSDSAQPTLLHLAAEQNFLHVTKSLAERYPGLMYLWTRKKDDNPSSLPVELALKKYKDDTAAYLISQMRHDR